MTNLVPSTFFVIKVKKGARISILGGWKLREKFNKLTENLDYTLLFSVVIICFYGLLGVI